MKGKARLVISKEDVLEALQQWLDQRWTVDSPVIADISPLTVGTMQNLTNMELHLVTNKQFLDVLPAVAGDSA